MKLQTLGWNNRFESLFAPFRASKLQPARVTGEAGPPAVGDWVGLDESGGGAVVRVILPRAGALARRRPGEPDHEQVAAANVDLVLVVESLDRRPNPRRIERATAIAWDGGATPAIVLTKMDLVENLEDAVTRAKEGAPFADVIAVSATTGEGMDGLAAMLVENTTAVLLGPSGVGKSTLANRLLGEEKFATMQVRESDRKGRHTTTHRELVILPGGACLIDTPGVRELGLWLDPEAVGSAFPEIEEAARRCRFGDCRHENEPGCAVLEDVERRILDPARLASFLRLRREAENLDMRRDESRRSEIRARERSFGRMVRQALRHKKDR
jgi:ribosome biogenesis GTPase